MFEFIDQLFGRSLYELEKMRRALVVVVILTIVGVAAILFLKPTVGVCVWITLLPWIISMCKLFSIKRFIRMHVTGEVLELAHVSVKKPTEAAAAPPQETGILDNPFIRIYLSVISNVLLAQTALFLMLPLYINYTVGGMTTAIIIVMLLVIVAIDNFTSFKSMSRFAVKASVVAYTVALIFMLFPQAGFYANSCKKSLPGEVSVIKPSTAKLFNELREVEEKQQLDEVNAYVQGIVEWRKAHPGEELPQEHKDALERAKLL